MKKLALILALVSLMALCFSSMTVNAAPPKLEDYFPQVAAPTEEEALYPTTWNYHVGVDQLTDPAGSWSWADTFEGKNGCWGQNNNTLPVDCNLKTIFWESRDVDFSDKGATHVRQVVFTDAFTQSGLGEYGRQNPQKKIEDFEQITVIYSADGQNWNTTKDFTVAFHTTSGSWTDYFGNERPYDTVWHLILDEAIPVEQCKFMGFHSSENKAWDAQNHAYSLGVFLTSTHLYLVKDTSSAPELIYPEAATTEAPTEAPTTEAPTEAPTTEAPTEAPATDAATTAPVTEPATENGGIDTWVWIVIAAAVVVVVVVVIVVAKKKK